MVSVANWINLLALTPYLEFLRLSESVAPGPEPLPPPGTTVALPRLRKLVLEGREYDDGAEVAFASLLACLATPAGCSIAMAHGTHSLLV